MSTITMVSPQHALTKPCTSASCCSPSRLWKNIQLLINQDQREGFRTLLSDSTKLPHVVRVLLNSRLSNNPLVYSKPTTQIDRRIINKFGKLSVTDLNALEIALLQRHDHIAYAILVVLKKNATAQETNLFVNHQWGKEKLSSLHLAAFWGMSKLVRLLLDLGADPSVQNHCQLRPIDCTTHSDTIHLLAQYTQQQQQKQQPKPQQQTQPQTQPLVVTKRPSLLLKKAEKSMMRPLIADQHYFNTAPTFVVADDYNRQPTMSPLSFSSSTSSSSFSSLSSTEYHWTPPASPAPFETPLPKPTLVEESYLAQKLAKVTISLPVSVTREDANLQYQQQIPERPGCFPRHSSSSNNNDTTMDKQNSVSQSNKKKKKAVQFSPRVILLEACTRGDKEELIRILEQHKVDFNTMRDVKNRSLLHVAMMHCQEELVEFLIDKVDVNHADNDGWTCLHYAAALKLWRSLEFFISIPHCDLDAQTNHGLSIQDAPNTDIAKRKCKMIIEKTLLSKKL